MLSLSSSTPISVTALSDHIRRLLEGDLLLDDLRVAGEISGFKQWSSGHCYFTLKDADPSNRAQIDCVIWKTNAARLRTMPRDGDRVVLFGSVKAYPDKGKYQLYVTHVETSGVGDLYQQFEALKAKLAAEGLFDVERKRPLPAFPARIGVVTSADGAALQDVLNVLRRRYPLVEVTVAPTLVQGTSAPARIVKALRALIARGDSDVILICRGGGSIEDLWAFNDEALARAIAASPIPTIAGIGHEIDTTIADFVADLRAPTPSAAAELLTPDINDLREALANANARLRSRAAHHVQARGVAFARAARDLRRASPIGRIGRDRQRLDERLDRLTRAAGGHLRSLRERLAGRTDALTARDPLAILQRGVVRVSDADSGAPYARAADVPARARLRLQFSDSSIIVTRTDDNA